MEKPIGASPGRALEIQAVRRPEDHPNLSLEVVGVVPRWFWNWYEVPPETAQLQEITGRLGKYFELALVFTWISGLLNILAVWDCVQGPSLGYGDEKPAEKESETKESPKPADDPPPPAATVAAIDAPVAAKEK
jgi:hypothetical protein